MNFLCIWIYTFIVILFVWSSFRLLLNFYLSSIKQIGLSISTLCRTMTILVIFLQAIVLVKCNGFHVVTIQRIHVQEFLLFSPLHCAFVLCSMKICILCTVHPLFWRFINSICLRLSKKKGAALMLHFSDNLLTKPKTTVHLTGLNPHTNLWSHALQHLMKHGSSSTAKTFSLFTQKIKLIDHMVHILLSCSKCKWTAGTEGMWQN